MRFSYQAATREGRRVSGTIEAASRTAARSALHRRRLFPLEIVEPTRRGDGRPAWLRATIPFRSRRALALEFARELTTLLGAGFSLHRALGLLGDVVRDDRVAAIVAEIQAGIRRGVELSEALRAYPDVFPEYFVQLVAAGERSGELETVFARLTEHLEEQAAVREEIRSALVYPVLMTLVGGIAVVVLLVFVIPRFVTILEGTNQELPLATAVLLGASELVVRFWWAMAALIGMGAWAWAGYRRTAEGRRRLDAFELRVPVWGELRRQVLTARFGRVLAILLRSGVPYVEALGAASRPVDNVVVRERLERAREQARKGERLAGALEEERVPFPSLAFQMIRLGEESGELDAMLEKVSRIYEQKVRERTRRLVSLLEPALILFFGILVAFVALAMLQAVFAIQQVPL